MEPSLRERLGGRRAISWQAVVIGDLLIVSLATLLAVAEPGDREPLDAATDVFAIAVASAVAAALYTGVAHLTIFRNRAYAPLPIPVTIGFHLSIAVMFIVGFTVGAAVLGVPALGGGPAFVIAVLTGGLLICLPTALVLDASDRYNDARRTSIRRIAELERLRISEWSLRRALRTLAAGIADDSVSADVVSRLDVLDLSEDTHLSTKNWWRASQAHHRGDHFDVAATTSSQVNNPRRPDGFADYVSSIMADKYPVVRWSLQLPNAFGSSPRSVLLAMTLAAFMTWLFLAPFVPSSVGLPVGLGGAISVLVVYGIAAKMPVNERVSPIWSLIITVLLAAGVSIALTLINPDGSSTAYIALVSAMAAMSGAFVSVVISSWAAAVHRSRDVQLRELNDTIARRSSESAAAFASLTAVVTRLAEAPPLAHSVAIAACATGLQRVQRDIDPVHACRILDWTESIIAAPGVLQPTNLAGRIDEVVHPWRALADITVTCPHVDLKSDVVDNIVAIVDEAVRNACRHGDAQVISVTVSIGSRSDISIEVVDDGVGLTATDGGVGFELFTTLGSGGFQAVPRVPGPGTTVVVSLDPTRSATVPG